MTSNKTISPSDVVDHLQALWGLNIYSPSGVGRVIKSELIILIAVTHKAWSERDGHWSGNL